MVVDVASAYINPLDVSSFEISIEVLPQLANHVVYNISSFDPYFLPDECRLVSLALTKKYGPGNSAFDWMEPLTGVSSMMKTNGPSICEVWGRITPNSEGRGCMRIASKDR